MNDVLNGQTQRTGTAIKFTFPDSGITVGLQRLAPDTINVVQRAIRKDTPPPEPPTQEVDYGDGSKRLEQNIAHPEYVQAMQEYEQEIAVETGNRLMRLIARRAVVDIDGDEVIRLREDMEAIGAPLDEPDDKVVYIRHICVSSPRDYEALTDFIMQHSQPTEAAVQEHKESFRSDV